MTVSTAWFQTGTAACLALATAIIWSEGRGTDLTPTTPTSEAIVGTVPEPVYIVGPDNGLFRVGGSSGAPAVVLFFRSDCTACARQRPFWNELANSSDARGVAVWAVTTEAPSVAVNSFLSVPAVAGRFHDAAKAFRHWGLAAVPTTIVIDRRGSIAFFNRGVLTTQRQRDLVRALRDVQGDSSRSHPVKGQ